MTFERPHNSFRAAVLDQAGSPVVTGKKSRGDRLARSLAGTAVPRSEFRRADSREGDRHRLSDAEAIVRKGRRSFKVDLINISGGGAMVEGSLVARLWQPLTLILGDIGEVECAVRWIKDDRFGLEFAHETTIDCEPAVLNDMLRKVLTDSPPEVDEESETEALLAESPAVEPEAPRDPRRGASRHPLIWSGIIQLNHDSVVARIRNISAVGAQIESSADYAIGSDVLLDLGNAGAIPATVRWTRGDQAGLAFHQPFDIHLLAKVQPKVARNGWVKPDYLKDENSDSSPWASEWGRLTIKELRQTLFR